MDTNVFNFIINLILDIPDLRTGLFMLTLVFTGRLRALTLDQVDIPKEHLKLLLKVQTICLLEAVKSSPLSAIDEVQSEYSLISNGDQSEGGSKAADKIEKQRRLQEQFFPEIGQNGRKSMGDDSSLIKSFKFFDIEEGYEMVAQDKSIKNDFEMIDYDM